MNIWFAQHQAAMRTAWARLWSAPLNTALALLVMAIALTLPAGGFVVLDKLSALSERVAAAQQISLFMQTDASAREVAEVESRLRERPEHFRYVSKDTAWREMQTRPGMSDVLVGLTRNPLPDAFVIDVGGLAPSEMDMLRSALASWPKVAQVQLDSAWVERLEALLQIGHILVGLLAALFAVGLVLIVFNTIRMQVLAQADEIEVLRLMGATSAFIRRPFAYLGALQGFLGSVLAVLFLSLALNRLQAPVAELSLLYGGTYALGGMQGMHVLALMVGGALLGLLGAWLAVALSMRTVDA